MVPGAALLLKPKSCIDNMLKNQKDVCAFPHDGHSSLIIREFTLTLFYAISKGFGGGPVYQDLISRSKVESG